MKELMSQEAQEARRRYMQQWREKNKEKTRRQHVKFWERLAEKYQEEEQKEAK